MYVAAYYGHLKVLKLLKNLGGEFKPSIKGTTILHVASKKGFIDIVRYILHEAKESNFDARKANGLTPVMLAVAKNHLFIVRMLKEVGANLHLTLDGKTQGGQNLLYIAAQNGHDVIVSYLLDKKIFLDAN